MLSSNSIDFFKANDCSKPFTLGRGELVDMYLSFLNHEGLKYEYNHLGGLHYFIGSYLFAVLADPNDFEIIAEWTKGTYKRALTRYAEQKRIKK